MTALALTLDVLAAGAIASVAALWIVWKGVQFVRATRAGGACACGPAKACGSGGTMAQDLRRAAARGAARAVSTSTRAEPHEDGVNPGSIAAR